MDAESSWRALLAGRSGVGLVRDVDLTDLPSRIAGQIHDLDAPAVFGVRRARALDRFAQLAVLAARAAVLDAGFLATGGDRWSAVIGTGLGGVETIERAMVTLAERGPRWMSPYTASAMIPNAAVASVSMDLGCRGRTLCPTTACAAGADAIGIGADMIRLGRADVVLAGGAEAPVTRAMLAGFAAMRASSTRNDDPEAACRPFDRDRDGLVMGEGAAVLVLEEASAAAARGARVLGEVAGYGASSDAQHITAPDPAGTAAERAVREAMAEAGIDRVDHVNAHGTGTRRNDAAEAAVLARVLGPGVPTSATKAATGHLMGAGGALEAAFSLLTLRDGVMPPTRNCEHQAPECDGIQVVRTPTAADIDTVLSTSFGFGGHNAALVLRRLR
ncbi:MAG: beta-ketoacyl-[acyl-carrier-protein] synthase family protein [Geodermatophilaceae bacterium]|nr:beta-ketoacyl-[acyl-carrier-protein] synthase family protein [Geodermatophilaceae bacterium]